MTLHLSSQEYVDAVDGTLSSVRQAHVARCAQCRAEVESLVGSVMTLTQDDVPEPSPLFWDHFPQRVQTTTQAEGFSASDTLWWARWKTVATAAIAVAGVVVAATIYTRPATTAIEPMDSVLGALETAASVTVEAQWEFVTNVLGSLETEGVRSSLSPSAQAVDAAFEDLSVEERENFMRLLRAEMDEGMQ
ncbi:MAG: hypothetical protein HQ485_00230 [Acidobacteria bacterium]|nr:hypothetical protein [Acidobacteriota bacterium]